MQIRLVSPLQPKRLKRLGSFTAIETKRGREFEQKLKVVGPEAHDGPIYHPCSYREICEARQVCRVSRGVQNTTILIARKHKTKLSHDRETLDGDQVYI